MKIIAKTEGGVIIEASETEVKDMLSSVTGERPKEIKIGTKIPAIDYSHTIKKLQTVRDNETIKRLASHIKIFNQEYDSLMKAVNDVHIPD